MGRMLGLGAVALALGGCAEVDSTELETKEIAARIEVRASGRIDSKATAYLKDGFDYVVLTGGDRLTITTDVDAARDFKEDSLSGAYEAPISKDATEATVALLREDKKSAPSSTVLIPAPLALSSPIDGTSVSMGEGELTLSWSNVIADATVDVWTVPCGGVGGGVGLFPKDPPDSGSLTIALSELGDAGDCVSIVVTRRVEGEADAALHGDSIIEGKREEQLDVTLTP